MSPGPIFLHPDLRILYEESLDLGLLLVELPFVLELHLPFDKPN